MDSVILKKKDILKLNVARGYTASLFAGSMENNAGANEPAYIRNSKGETLNIVVDTEKSDWVGTKEYSQHWNEIETILNNIRTGDKKINAAQLPDDYYDLIEKMSIDITKRRIEAVDYTAMIAKEQTNLAFSKSVNLKEFLGFVGEFQENNLTGDSVPLIEQRSGAVGSVEMQGYALGHVRSLEDILYNLDIFTIQKVNEAYVRAFIGKRNDLVFGTIIGLTTAAGWDASQTVAADATASTSREEKVYVTINNAIEALGKLYDFQSNQEINLSKMVIATGRNVDARKIDRAIRGQLNNSKGLTANREPLEVDEIWLYKGDSFTYGKKTISYPGIAANKAYLFVPGSAGSPNHVLVKRPLVTVTSKGDALSLNGDKEAKYFIQTKYDDEFLGTSSTNATIAANTDHDWGYIVEVNLPA